MQQLSKATQSGASEGDSLAVPSPYFHHNFQAEVGMEIGTGYETGVVGVTQVVEAMCFVKCVTCCVLSLVFLPETH